MGLVLTWSIWKSNDQKFANVTQIHVILEYSGEKGKSLLNKNKSNSIYASLLFIKNMKVTFLAGKFYGSIVKYLMVLASGI